MEQLTGFIGDILGHAVTRAMYPVAAGERIFALYLVCALLLAYLAFRLRHQALAPGEAFRRFLAYCFPKKMYAHRSAKLDYVFFLVNGVLFPLFAAPLVMGGAMSALLVGNILTHLLGAMAEPLTANWAVILLFTAALAVAMDAGVFITHYLQHRVPLLWEFHKVHHSAEVLTPITAYRVHPVDDLFTGSVSGLLVGCVGGAFTYFYGDALGFLSLAGLNVLVFAFYLMGYNLRHSHIWIAYPAWLSHVLISPAQHQIHHSRQPEHYDRNLGFMFAFWDWTAGTLYVPAEPEALDFGIDTEDAAAFSSVARLYLHPFARAARLTTRRKGASHAH